MGFRCSEPGRRGEVVMVTPFFFSAKKKVVAIFECSPLNVSDVINDSTRDSTLGEKKVLPGLAG